VAGGASAAAAHDDPGGSLPFTGLELAAIAALGAALVAAGVALRGRPASRRAG
jgi:hypothetical protein